MTVRSIPSSKVLLSPLMLRLWPWLAEVEASFPNLLAPLHRSDEDLLDRLQDGMPIVIDAPNVFSLYLGTSPEGEIRLYIDDKYYAVLDSGQSSEYFLLAFTNFGASVARKGLPVDTFLKEKLHELSS